MSKPILPETAQPMKLGLYRRNRFPLISVIDIDRSGNQNNVHSRP